MDSADVGDRGASQAKRGATMADVVAIAFGGCEATHDGNTQSVPDATHNEEGDPVLADTIQPGTIDAVLNAPPAVPMHHESGTVCSFKFPPYPQPVIRRIDHAIHVGVASTKCDPLPSVANSLGCASSYVAGEEGKTILGDSSPTADPPVESAASHPVQP